MAIVEWSKFLFVYAPTFELSKVAMFLCIDQFYDIEVVTLT